MAQSGGGEEDEDPPMDSQKSWRNTHDSAY